MTKERTDYSYYSSPYAKQFLIKAALSLIKMALNMSMQVSFPTPSPGYDLFHATQNNSKAFERVTFDTPQKPKEFLVWTHQRPKPSESNTTFNLTDHLDLIDKWLNRSGTEILVFDKDRTANQYPGTNNDLCIGSPCSSKSVCRPRLKCLFNTLLNAPLQVKGPDSHGSFWHHNIVQCKN